MVGVHIGDSVCEVREQFKAEAKREAVAAAAVWLELCYIAE